MQILEILSLLRLCQFKNLFLLQNQIDDNKSVYAYFSEETAPYQI